MQRKDQVRLKHMLDHAAEALDLVRDRSRSDLDGDRVLALALVRLLEIVGEAAGRASDEVQKQNPAIPWPQIVALRNRLIHGYDSVDMDIMWHVLTEDVPDLVRTLQAIAELQQM